VVELGSPQPTIFIPTQLLTRVPVLAKLVEARRLLLNPLLGTRQTALQACLGAINAPAESFANAAEPKSESTDDTMARLLGGALPVKKPAPPASQLDQFIRQAIAPHISAAPNACNPVPWPLRKWN